MFSGLRSQATVIGHQSAATGLPDGDVFPNMGSLPRKAGWSDRHPSGLFLIGKFVWLTKRMLPWNSQKLASATGVVLALTSTLTGWVAPHGAQVHILRTSSVC